ncbi:Transposase [Acinetobacter boissieri]|uniref:Transposase n=1 Tax=Acinetobacter boissieri TaxID=1219383 RepID=A0A1G6GQW4_9GAMM|nr:Transposase [Acinetobacter boissieri]
MPLLALYSQTIKNVRQYKMSYSEHFRRKVIAKIEDAYSIRAVSAQFEIDKNTILSWKKRIGIKKTRPRKPFKIDDDALRRLGITVKKDLTPP